MTDGLTPRAEAFLASRRLADLNDDISAAEIRRMSMADYAAIRRRAGLPDVDPFAQAYASYEPPSSAPGQDPAAAAAAG